MSPSDLAAILTGIALVLGALGKLIVDVASVRHDLDSRMTEVLSLLMRESRAERQIEGTEKAQPAAEPDLSE